MSRVILIGICVSYLSSLCAGAYVEYQGAGGNLATASSWYVITDPGDPASRTGETRLPLPYGGTYPGGTLGDTAIVRNGTSTTLSSALSTQNLLIGGPQITGQPTGPATNVYVTSGGTLTVYSDDPLGDPLRLAIGGAYPATLNVNGGYVDIYPRRGGGLLVGAGGTARGVLNLSAGTVEIRRPAANAYGLTVGENGCSGVLNQSGGLLSRPAAPGDWQGGQGYSLNIGHGAYGEYNLSGGYVRVTDWPSIGSTGTGGTSAGTGLLNITGGTFQYGYKMTVGDARTAGIDNIGHLKIMGGTFRSWMEQPERILTGCSDLYIGRGSGGTAASNSIGKITVHQDAVVHTLGMIMANEGGDADSSQMELKLAHAGNFDVIHTDWFDVKGILEISLVNGYSPTEGAEWMIGRMTYDAIPESSLYVSPTLAMTPGFHLEKRNIIEERYRDLYLVCDGLRHGGDANNDGAVNVGDLGILAGNWQQVTVLGKSWQEGDFTGDDVVNVGDLGVLAGAWGWTGTPVPPPPGQVPEPASLALLALGALAMLRRRR
jgi:hypothetical protein